MNQNPPAWPEGSVLKNRFRYIVQHKRHSFLSSWMGKLQTVGAQAEPLPARDSDG